MDLHHKAEQRVKRKSRFYRNLATYVIMSIFFIALNLLTNPGKLWFQWPVLGWGIGIAAEYLKVFVWQNWEDRELEREIRRLEGRHAPVEDELDLPPAEKQPQKNWDDRELV